MSRIVHLTDLHFGYERRELVQPLLDLVNAQEADLVVVTGDITHRSRAAQWQQAADFMGQLRAPWVAVPGNHDVPLLNPIARALMPFAAFRRWLKRPSEFQLCSPRLQVLGINSADRWAWERGRIWSGQIEGALKNRVPDLLGIAALHHPLVQLPEVDKKLARGADHALRRLEAAGISVILSGHLHRFALTRLLALNPKMLHVQTGSALCRRKTDLQNEFTLLDFQGRSLALRRFIAPMDRAEFLPPQQIFLNHTDAGWQVLSDSDAF